MAHPNGSGKAMSSRLMNMKFMQRAATSPTSSSPKTPSEPPSKRQRLSHGPPASSSPGTPRSQTASLPQPSPQEHDQPNGGTQYDWARAEDSKWYLKFDEQPSAGMSPPMRIAFAGYSTIDGAPPHQDTSAEQDQIEHDTITDAQIVGRRSFGKFNRSIEKQTRRNSSLPSSEASESEEESGEEVSDDESSGKKATTAQVRDEAGDRVRAARKTKRKSESSESSRLAEDRRKKQVKLNQLTSISGSGNASALSRNSSVRDMTCHACGEKGHFRKDCPRASQQRHWKR